MMDSLPSAISDWIPLATAILGLIAGAFISEFHLILAEARKRRRALNVLLFDLLQLRFDVAVANPKLLLDALRRIVKKKFPNEEGDIIEKLGLETIFNAFHKDAVQSGRLTLTARYVKAISSLVPYDPMLAYRLSGNERIGNLEQAIAAYYARVSQLPEVARDPNSPQFLNVMEDETMTALFREVLTALANDIKDVAKARRWRLIRKIWTPFSIQNSLKRQDNIDTTRLDEHLEKLIDQVLSRVAERIRASTTAPS